MALDYSKLTDEQLQAIADKDYSKLPDDVLAHLADEHDAAQNPEAAPVNLSPDTLAARNDPLNSAVTGAIVGTTALGAKKGIDVAQAINNLNKGQPAPAAPPTPEPYVSPGQKWSSKTGFGAGEGETVREQDAEYKRIEAEKNKAAGRGKISSRITGGTPDEILARAKQEEAELAKQARIRAQEKLALEAKNKLAAATAMEQKLAHEAEQRFRVPNAVGKMLPVAGATAGYNIQDVINQDNPVQKGIAAVGAAGSATPFIKKLPPKLRAIGVGASLLAPVINRGIDAIQDHAAGGSIQHLAVGGLDKLAKKGVSGFLKHKPSVPNPLVGTRFKTTDMNRLLPQTPFNPDEYIGAKILHRPYDLSSRGRRVEEISGHTLTNPFETEGGQQFGRDKILQATGQGGASNKEINDRILKRVDAAAREGNGQVLNIPSTMGHGSEDFSTMPVTALLDLMKQREFNPTTLETLSNQVRAFDPKKFGNFVGFGKDQEELLKKQIMEGGYGLNTTPGQLRKIISDRLRLKGPKANNQELLDYNSEDLYNAIRDPNLKDIPPGFMGHTIMESQPGHPGFDIGNHSAYNAGDASKYVGQGINAPISVWMPDSYKQALAITRADPKTADWAIGHQRAMARNILGTQESGVAQTLTPEVADNLKKYQAAVESGELNPHDLDAIHQHLYGTKAPEYAAGGSIDHLAGGGVPEAVVKAYKLFKTKANKPGELYPLFVNATKSVPMGEWVKAEAGPLAASGKVKSKLGELANRPGWHAGDLPIATHIGGKSDPALKAPDFRRPDEVWAEVEMPNDVDWQSVANQRAALTKAGEVNPATAHITDQVPFGGHYRYKTNRNMEGNWLIGGDMKVNRVLSDEEVQAINDAAGKADLPRFTPFDEKADGGVIDSYAPGGKVGALEMLAKKLMPLAEREANKAKFLDPSAIKNVMYHGTAADISQFKPKQVGATFLTDSPNFAGGFADSSEHYLKQQLQNSLSSAELAKLNDQAHKLSRKTGESATDLYHQMLKERLPTGQNVMPVHVQATNPFDYDDPEHIANLRQYLQNNNSSRADAIADAIHGKGSWDVIEMPETQNAIKKMGHDSFYAQEGGNKNLGVYDPNKIKSAIGNEGTYDITNPDITKAQGGPIESIEKQLKKIRKHLKKHK